MRVRFQVWEEELWPLLQSWLHTVNGPEPIAFIASRNMSTPHQACVLLQMRTQPRVVLEIDESTVVPWVDQIGARPRRNSGRRVLRHEHRQQSIGFDQVAILRQIDAVCTR